MPVTLIAHYPALGGLTAVRWQLNPLTGGFPPGLPFTVTFDNERPTPLVAPVPEGRNLFRAG